MTALPFRCLRFALLGLALWALPALAHARPITDLLGRRVDVPDAPQRVVSMAPSITEIIYAVDRQDLLVGVTRYSDYPPAALDLPRIGSYVHLDLERIVSLKPDLCIATRDGNPKVVIDRLAALGIAVFALDPRNLETVMDTVRSIGDLLDAREEAKDLIGQMQGRIDAVHHRLRGIDERPGVFFQIGISPIVSAGTSTFIHELITAAGGKNLAAGPVPYPRFSREQVLALKPDVIIITSMARHAVFETVRAEWQRWPDMPAVKSGRIHLQESNIFDRPTPRLVDGLEQLAELIHPRSPEDRP